MPYTHADLQNLKLILGEASTALTENGISFAEARSTLAHVRDFPKVLSMLITVEPTDIYRVVEEILRNSKKIRIKALGTSSLRQMCDSQFVLKVVEVGGETDAILLIFDLFEPARTMILSMFLTIADGPEFEAKIMCSFPFASVIELSDYVRDAGRCIAMSTNRFSFSVYALLVRCLLGHE